MVDKVRDRNRPSSCRRRKDSGGSHRRRRTRPRGSGTMESLHEDTCHRHRRPLGPTGLETTWCAKGMRYSVSTAATGLMPPMAFACSKPTFANRPAEDVFRTERPDVVVHMATGHPPGRTQRGPLSHQPSRHTRGRRLLRPLRREAADLPRPPHLLRRAAGLAALPHGRRAPDGHSQPFRSLPTSSPPISLPAAPCGACRSSTPPFCASSTHSAPNDRAHSRPSFVGPRVPTVLGFDPLFHFMHEKDVARAVLHAIDAKLRGVFNVAARNPCRSA